MERGCVSDMAPSHKTERTRATSAACQFSPFPGSREQQQPMINH